MNVENNKLDQIAMVMYNSYCQWYNTSFHDNCNIDLHVWRRIARAGLRELSKIDESMMYVGERAALRAETDAFWHGKYLNKPELVSDLFVSIIKSVLEEPTDPINSEAYDWNETG